MRIPPAGQFRIEPEPSNQDALQVVVAMPDVSANQYHRVRESGPVVLAVYSSTDAFELERVPRATATVILVLQSVAASIFFDESMKTIIS
jgi:hypothetical protein